MYNGGHATLTTTFGDGKDSVKQINQYRKLYLLGEGSFSKVFLAEDMNTKEYYAIKRINLKSLTRTSVGVHQLEREIQLTRDLHHQNIVNLKEVIYVQDKNMVYLVVDYADCGNLESLLRNGYTFSPNEVKCLVKQVAEGVAFLHKSEVVHQDLKPANILLKSDGTALISDFGIGRSFQSAAMVVGTPAYQAPEVVDENCEYDEEEEIDPRKEDIWSLGVTIYQLVFHKLPFSGRNVYEIVQEIENTELAKPKGADDQLWDLIKHMLTVSPSQRYTIEQVLQHPYLKDIKNSDAPKIRPFTLPPVSPDIKIIQINGIVCDSNYSFANEMIASRTSLPKFAAPFQ